MAAFFCYNASMEKVKRVRETGLFFVTPKHRKGGEKDGQMPEMWK